MSDKDAVTKDYIKQPVQFADLFNGFCFDGEEIIRPEDLQEMDTTEIVLPYGSDGATLPEQKTRDVLKSLLKTDGKAAYCILGVENQSEIHNAMAIRNMLYDAITLAGQVEKTACSYRKAHDYGANKREFLSGFHLGDKVLPVITIVLHWGTDAWDAPLSLREMYPDDMNPKIVNYAADYKVNLVSPATMTDAQLDIFRSDLKEVLKFIKHSDNKEALMDLVNRNHNYQKLDKLAAQTISVCTNVDFKVPEGEELVDVCKAIEDIKKDALDEERRNTAVRMIKAGKLSLEEIAAYLAIPLANVKEIKNSLA
ncbi:Rpn family recombination-promoting nuclease/putative transposase [Selenomonas ruminantium]|uniref:Rpn family recombination-promoting nuclease/putative transposase n=1 Tax=Selenomonas ruminantium TaxID=971 RepID=UPI00068482F2|nr:Rpn family recombination-promoting nuclease/putative transposase [Selenomonas ruminantium]